MSDITERSPRFRRVLLKMSGEALMGAGEFGHDPSVLNRLAGEVCSVHALGIEQCLVIGGGNIVRGDTVAELIELKNDERAKSGNPIHKRLSVDAEVRRVLADDGWTLDAVPGADTTVWLRRTSNISTGGDAAILEINGSPMFSMHHFPWVGTPRNVIGGVLDVMFPATAR
jgi:D-alanine-D-alanine ligase-like ATP-grasp enzyme